jgi:hypothetical protein
MMDDRRGKELDEENTEREDGDGEVCFLTKAAAFLLIRC